MIEINEEINEILFLGTEGTYCEIAKNELSKTLPIRDITHKHFSSIKNIIEYVEKNNKAIAVLPIENSIEGIVRETMDTLLNLDDEKLKITNEIVLPVKHCLLSKAKHINKIEKIISHPQALAQCSKFIEKNFDTNIEKIEKSSTAKAAKELLILDETYAAIGSQHCANLFRLNVLAKNINDEDDNKTRFILLSRIETKSSKDDKTSIAFATKNQAGALVKVLNVFDALNINLLYIDSRPSKKNLGEYIFFVDFEGHITDEPTQKVLDLIKLNTNFIKILGSYKKF